MSLACVSAILISAFRRLGLATRARLVPGATCWPTSTGTSCSMPVEAGAHLQLVALLLRQAQQRARLVDQRLLHGELRLHRLGLARELLLRNLVAHAELIARRPATASARGPSTS